MEGQSSRIKHLPQIKCTAAKITSKMQQVNNECAKHRVK